MNISLPTNLSIKEAKDNKATVVIEPCYPGYGVTLGNSLRRVLLSSIEGTAITAIKVNGAQHEFSALPNVSEDLVEIIMNVKKIRLKSFADEPVVLNINVKGQKIVTAADIEKNSQVEVINGNQIIATLTSKDAKLEMELVVEKGRGYVTVDERGKHKADIGSILIDAIYSPLFSVSFEIENMRVGERTDYERLVLKLETDGSITPKESLERASEILVDHFSFIYSETAIDGSRPKAALAEAENFKTESKDEISDEVEAEDKPKKRGRPKKNDK